LFLYILFDFVVILVSLVRSMSPIVNYFIFRLLMHMPCAASTSMGDNSTCTI
jgi:hypothetical protein